MLGAYATNLVAPNSTKLTAAREKAHAKLSAEFAKLDDTGACTSVGDATTTLGRVDAFVAELLAPSRMTYKGEPVDTMLGEAAVITGSLDVAPDTDALNGQLTVTYGSGGRVTLSGVPDGLQIQVGASTYVIQRDSLSVLRNGAPVAIQDFLDAVAAGVALGTDPAQWSPEAQAAFGLLALNSTPAWLANVGASRRVGAHARLTIPGYTPRTYQPGVLCQAFGLGISALGVAGDAGCGDLLGSLCGPAVWLCGIPGAKICNYFGAGDWLAGYEASFSTCTQVCDPNAPPVDCYPPGFDPATAHTGACKPGTIACKANGSGYEACRGFVLPVPEVCGDGVDEDCNGLPDAIDPACSGDGGGAPGVTQLTHGGALPGGIVLSADGHVVVFEGGGGVSSVHTDGTGLYHYPSRGLFPPGCDGSLTDCTFCESSPHAPIAVDGTGTLVAYTVTSATCGDPYNTILLPDGPSDASAPFGSNTQYPSTSNDGTLVAFLRGNGEVWVSDPTGLVFNAKLISCCGATEPQVSGDGNHVIYPWGAGELRTVTVAGGEATARTIVTAPIVNFSISSDASRIAFSSYSDVVAGENPDGSSEVFLWEDGVGIRQLTHTTAGAYAPAISGDGATIAFLFDGDVYKAEVATGTLTRAIQIPSGRSAYMLTLDATGHIAVFPSNGDLTGENSSGRVELFAARIP